MISSRGSSRLEAGRGRATEEVDDDRPARQPGPARGDGVTELVGEGRDEERGRHHGADEPRTRAAELGGDSAACVAAVTPMTARMMAHDTWTRISNPNSRAIGTAFIAMLRLRAATWSRPWTAEASDRCVAVPTRRALASPRWRDDHGATTMHTDPDDDRRLLPELEREELDQPLRGRVEGVRATREEELVEDLEQRVEGDERDDATGHERGDQDAVAPSGPRRQVRARSGPRRRAAIDERHRRLATTVDREEADEHAPDVAHVPPFALVEDRFAGDRDVEVGRAEHEVGQDARPWQLADPAR